LDRPKLDYDRIASRYDARFTSSHWSRIADALHPLAAPGDRVLEAGCGTGRWLSEFVTDVSRTGLDRSREMLLRAQAKSTGAGLVQADANALPFRAGAFHLVYVVHALHHFSDPQDFIHSATALLVKGGSLAIVALDPRVVRDRWFIYDYFEETWELDMRRFPSRQQILNWMAEAGLVEISEQVVERASATRTGIAILDDPFLAKDQLSQLALLSNEAYARGLEKIRLAAERGAVFPVELESTMTIGRRPA
jgi:SAM-dependent methyltransferase